MLKNRFTVAKLGWQPRWYNPDLEKWLHRIKLPSLIAAKHRSPWVVLPRDRAAGTA